MTAQLVPERPAPEVIYPTVVEALARVIEELPAIGRDGRASQQQGGYAYRGIEQITAAAAPLFAKHGVVFVPQVIGTEFRELTVNGKPWTDTILTVRYRICGPGGDYVEATVVGIGRDNSDKGANKALTQAFKYALIQVLCIADAKDDGDSATHEADAPERRGPTITERQEVDLGRRLETVGKAIGGYPDGWIEAGLPPLKTLGELEVARLFLAEEILTAAEKTVAPATDPTLDDFTEEPF